MKFTHFTLFVSLLLAVASCVDKKFDLDKDINKNITVGGDLALPLGSTDTMRLSKFIPDDNDLLQIDANGRYSIAIKDSVETELPTVGNIGITVPSHVEENQINFSGIGVDEMPLPDGISDLVSLQIPNTSSGIGPVPVGGLSFILPRQVQFNFNLGYSIPNQVHTIHEVLFGKENTPGDTVQFNIDFSQIHSKITGGNFQDTINLQIKFPSGFVIEKKSASTGEIVGDNEFRVVDYLVEKGKNVTFSFFLKKLKLEKTGTINYTGDITYNLRYGLFVDRGANIGANPEISVGFKAPFNFQDALITTNTIAVPVNAVSFNINSGTTDIPSEVKRIDTVRFVPAATNKFSFSINTPPNFPLQIASGDKLVMKFPPEFKFKSDANLTGTDYTIPSSSLSGENNVFELELDYLYLGKEITQGAKLIDDNITVESSTLRLAGKKLKFSDLGSLHDPKFTVSLLGAEIQIASVSGKVNIDVGKQHTSLDLSSLPEFLRGNDVNLALKSPIIKLHASNPLGVPLDIDVDLVAKTASKPNVSEKVRLNIDNAKGPNSSAESYFWLASTNKGLEVPYTWGELDVMKLIKSIPDSISIDIIPTINQDVTTTIYLSDTQKGKLKVNYDVNIPLDFEKDFQIVYADTIKDLLDGLSDFTKYASSVELIAKITNSIPLELDLKMTPLDSTAHPIGGLTIEVTNKIPAGKTDGTPTTEDFKVLIDEVTPGSLAKLNAIEISVTAKSAEAGGALQSTQYVFIEMSVKVNGGITIDLDE